MSEIVSTLYRIFTKVQGIKQDKGLWYILLEGSWEWINIGDEEPILQVHDKIEVNIRKI